MKAQQLQPGTQIKFSKVAPLSYLNTKEIFTVECVGEDCIQLRSKKTNGATFETFRNLNEQCKFEII